MFSRRQTLAMLASVSALPSCTSVANWINNNNPSLSTLNLKLLVGYSQAIAVGLGVAVPFVVQAKLVSAGDAANILLGEVSLQNAAKTIGASQDLAAAETITAVELLTLVTNTIVDVVAAIPTPPMPVGVHLGFMAAAALLPIIEGLAGLFTPPSTAVAQAAKNVSPTAAQTILNNLPKVVTIQQTTLIGR